MSFHNENTKVGIEGNSLNENGTYKEITKQTKKQEQWKAGVTE